jgi:hypothetical protein
MKQIEPKDSLGTSDLRVMKVNRQELLRINQDSTLCQRAFKLAKFDEKMANSEPEPSKVAYN